MSDDQNTQDNKDIQEEQVTADEPNTEPANKEAELTEALARAMADLQNYKRRSEEEKASFVKFASTNVLKALFPTIDNLGRSVDHLPEDMKDNEWAKGVINIHADLLKTLEGMGIRKMETVGQTLDPNKHEALMAGPGEKDVITEEFEPGYMMGEDVVKPAKVKVGDGS